MLDQNYDEIDHEIVYNICKDYLSALKSTIEKIINENFK